MSAKRTRGERLPSPSSSKEEDPQTKRFDRCPVLIGKNVDLGFFTFDAPSFHIEDLFVGMGWVGILTLDDKVYPSLVKDFYKKMVFSPGTEITCFLKNKRIKITRDLICSLLRLESGGISLYTTKTIPHIEGEYDPVAACCHVTGNHFDALTRLSTNQLILTCRVLHNIIAHIIVPRKGHHDEVNHYDVFLLDSILLGRKLNFPYIMIQHMNSVLSGTRPKALPYGMILTKVFEHFGVSVLNTIALVPKATDTINTLTLKRMKIFKENGQWGGKVQRDYFNLLNGRIDSLTSTVDGMQLAVNDLHNTATTIQAKVDGIQATVGGLQSSVDGITSMLHALHSYLGTDFLPPEI
ncbi:Uncharacterized protein Adt_16933 [Abeliophyllum distichum]|uniref:Putative plant transposon protein domain-containing protein n=1 Tax=Abeliophyllum distichum TaxID=126358 RepID=A0ABD1TF20_9LAMI